MEQNKRLIQRIKEKSAHSIFYTERLPVFENLYNNPNVRSLELIGNRVNPHMYFDKNYKLNSQERILFESLITLYEDDFVQFYMPSSERLLRQMSLESANETTGLMYIYSRKYNVMHSLADPGIQKFFFLIKEILKDKNELVHWIFHFSHDKIASIESFKSKVVDHYNYGLLLVVDSDNPKNKKITSRAIANLNSVASDIRHQMMVSYCDVSKQKICRELVVMFELEDHQLPLVRMLYRADDHSKEEVGQEQIFYKFSLDREVYKQTIDDVKNGRSEDGKAFWYLLLY